MGWQADGSKGKAKEVLHGHAGCELVFADSVEAECSFGIRNPDQELVTETLEKLGLAAYRERHPNTLSGGQNSGWLWRSV